jgi:LysM repeat protein/GH25 family lysozyme M1 (1,4-beta-N-acetylmuramidase)
VASYTVRPGDTLSAIAARNGVGLGALEAANPQIRNPNLIYSGQAINVPDGFNAPKAAPVNLSGTGGPGNYTVRAGDTLSAIGSRYGISYQAIAQANGISNPNLIFPGQTLRIPGVSGPVAAPSPAPAPSSGTTYTVRSGDSLGAIGARFGVSWQAIAQANRIPNPNLIYPGQVLQIPRGGPGAPAPMPSPGPTGPVGNPGGWNPNNSGKLYGADTSSWQSQGTFESTLNGAQYSMIKASEGTGFVDPTFRARWDELGQKVNSGQMALRVAYQFMTPGNGVAQAQHFLNTVGINGPMPAGTRLCLDWEASALNDPQALHDAANYIHNVTGLWPLIYTSGSQVGRAQAAAPQAPIWEAKWGGSVPGDVPFVQYSDGGGALDHDVFNGDLAALRHFAGWN